MDTQNSIEQPKVEQQVEITTEQNNEQEQQNLDSMITLYASKSREELVMEMKNQLEKGDFEDLRIRIPLIRNAFLALPKPEIQHTQQVENTNENGEIVDSQNNQQPENIIDETEKTFNELYNIYKQKRQQYLQQQEEQKQDNLNKKKQLLDELRNLLDSDKLLKDIYDDFNAIQEKWKTIGNVPHNEINNLWESYHFLIDKFYEKVKINRELRELDMKKNLEEKLILCEKAEELLLSEDIMSSFQILQEYHKQWKEIGIVPSDKNNEVWERFKKASDDINARRRDYYEKRNDELEENLKLKREIIEKASEINAHERNLIVDWNKDADLMNELVEKWKTIGPVPKEYNDDIWAKFKAHKDGFFEARKEMFAKNKQIEEENYSKKVSICERAEEIAKRSDFNQATKELKDLQEEWKTIGHVRKPLGDQIWTRFRAACDEFFRRKSEDYMQTHQEVEENIKKKEQLIEELKSHIFTENKAENVEKLKDFQKRWFEVGFTPRQERKRLQEQWDEIIQANKEKLQITAEEIAQKGVGFINNISAIADNTKKSLTARLQVIDRQINSLENNLGFLANSKNANILKQEFENKINNLKNQKIELENRIKEFTKSNNTEKTVNEINIKNEDNKNEVTL